MLEVRSWSPRVRTSVGDPRDDLRTERKDVGGWSLEELDGHGACGGWGPGDGEWSANWYVLAQRWESNWVASVSALGGLDMILVKYGYLCSYRGLLTGAAALTMAA